MKKLSIYLLLILFSACAIVDDRPVTDEGSGAITDYNQLWKDRVSGKSVPTASFDKDANLTYLTETYTFDSSIELGKGIYKKDGMFYGVIAGADITKLLSMTKTGVVNSADIDWDDLDHIVVPDYNQLWKERVSGKNAGTTSFDNNANLTYLTETYTFDSSIELGKGIYKKGSLYYGVIASEDITKLLNMTKTGVVNSVDINWDDVKSIIVPVPDPEVDPDPDAGKKRFIANLRNLDSLYIGDSDVNIGENGTITYAFTNTSTTPETITPYTYYLKEIKNDTQALYSTTNSFEYLGVEWKTVGHTGFSIEGNEVWGYYPINNEYSIKLFNIDMTDSANKDIYEATAKKAHAAELISFDNPGFRFFYKRDNSSLTDINTLNLKSSYTKDDVITDYAINPTIYKRYITNSVTVTVSPDKNTISYTKPQASPIPSVPNSVNRVLTFHKMQGSEAIYTAPATPGSPTPVYYYAIAIKDNTIYMGFRGATLNLKQRNLGYWLY